MFRRALYLGGQHLIAGGGGGGGGGLDGVFVADILFISTRPGDALKILLDAYRTVLEINYLFHADSIRNYLFQKYSTPSLPGD